MTSWPAIPATDTRSFGTNEGMPVSEQVAALLQPNPWRMRRAAQQALEADGALDSGMSLSSARRSLSAIRRLHGMLRSASVLVIWAAMLAPRLVGQESTQAQVLAADDQRFAAMLRADTVALRTMLATDLSYTHTTGEKQDRAAFLQTIGTGQLRYKNIEPSERSVRLLNSDAAVVVGRSNMQVEASGQLRTFSIRYVAVYQHSASGWQLVVWQSTRLPT